MVTIKLLAEQLHVSVSTVSKALNDSSEISSATTRRVKDLAKHYNYHPNRTAVNLKSSQTKTIGVILPNILNRFFAKVLFGIEKEATKKGYNIITCISNESLDKEKESLQLLTHGAVDGFIVAVSEDTQTLGSFDHFNTILQQGVPIVMFDRVLNQVPCDKVIIDDFEASCKATDALIQQNRKHIAFITTIDDLNIGKLREDGYKKTMMDAVEIHDTSLVLKIQGGEDLHTRIKAFLSNNPQINGVVSADNISGTTCINTCISMGYKVPKDIAVIGFADETISQLSVPKLSFINQHAEEIGKNSINLLLDRLSNSNNKEFVTKVIPTTLLHAQSA